MDSVKKEKRFLKILTDEHRYAGDCITMSVEEAKESGSHGFLFNGQLYLWNRERDMYLNSGAHLDKELLASMREEKEKR